MKPKGRSLLSCPVECTSEPKEIAEWSKWRRYRKELLASIRPNYQRYLRPDTGDMPDGYTPPPSKPKGLEILQSVS